MWLTIYYKLTTRGTRLYTNYTLHATLSRCDRAPRALASRFQNRRPRVRVRRPWCQYTTRRHTLHSQFLLLGFLILLVLLLPLLLLLCRVVGMPRPPLAWCTSCGRRCVPGPAGHAASGRKRRTVSGAPCRASLLSVLLPVLLCDDATASSAAFRRACRSASSAPVLTARSVGSAIMTR